VSPPGDGYTDASDEDAHLFLPEPESEPAPEDDDTEEDDD
jgi:hypothetical protein